MKLYYKKSDGSWITQYEIETAFYLSSGISRFSNEKKFLCWLYPLLGKTIICAKREDDPDLVTELLKSKQKYSAIKVYKAINHCTLKEARDAIDAIVRMTK